MRKSDDDEGIRRRAHDIWEREGKPHGREHEHWAEAARQLAEVEEVKPSPVQDEVELVEETEAIRLRRALYALEAFTVDLLDEDGSDKSASNAGSLAEQRGG